MRKEGLHKRPSTPFRRMHEGPSLPQQAGGKNGYKTQKAQIRKKRRRQKAIETVEHDGETREVRERANKPDVRGILEQWRSWKRRKGRWNKRNSLELESWKIINHCKYCGESFSTKSQFWVHMSTHKPEPLRQWLNLFLFNIFLDDISKLTLLLMLCKTAPFALRTEIDLQDLNFALSTHCEEENESTDSMFDSPALWERENNESVNDSWQTLPQILSLVTKRLTKMDSKDPQENSIFSLTTQSLLNEGGTSQITTYDPNTKARVLTILTVWESNGTLKQVETLIDTGCNITAIRKELVDKLTTRSGQPIQIGQLSQPVRLQTCAMKRIEAIGKVELGFRLGGEPMKHNFLVFSKLPYEIIMGTEFIYSKGLKIDLHSGVIYTEDPLARTTLCSYTLNTQQIEQEERVYALQTKEETTILPMHHIGYPSVFHKFLRTFLNLVL